jgi:hypothetical protein
MGEERPRVLYYIAPEGNLPSILERGILSPAAAEGELASFERIYARELVERRRRRPRSAASLQATIDACSVGGRKEEAPCLQRAS